MGGFCSIFFFNKTARFSGLENPGLVMHKYTKILGMLW